MLRVIDALLSTVSCLIKFKDEDVPVCDSALTAYFRVGDECKGYSQMEKWRGASRSAIAAIAALGFAASAVAADIETIPPKKVDDRVLITIDGEIKSGDDEKFRKIAAEYSDAIVLLNSEGGMIGPAMDIGRTIKLRGYGTAIYKTGSCASACALIWVAGSKRVVFEGGQVGFHASYLDTDGTKLETGVGNALVGHYLSQLGFGEKTVVFATLAPPDKILWLNDKTASMSGIEFTAIPGDEKRSTPQVAERQSAPPIIKVTVAPPPPVQREDAASGNTAGYQRYMGDAKQTLRTPEAFAAALQQQGYQAKISYSDPNAPTMETGMNGEKIQVAFSDCDKSGCNYIELLDYYNDMSNAEINAVLKKHASEEYYSHPLWVSDAKYLAFYNYIVIGSDGITAKTLIENINYFIKTNGELLQVVVDMRNRK